MTTLRDGVMAVRLRAFKYRIRSTPQLDVVLGRHAGARRFAYNWAVEQLVRHDALADHDLVGKLGVYALLKRWAVEKKRHARLVGVSKWATERGVVDAVDAWARLDQGLADAPRFKRRRSSQGTFRFPQSQDSIRVVGSELHLPVIGAVRLRLSRPVVGKTLNVTIKEVSRGKWDAVIQVEERFALPERKGHAVVGLDLGLHHAIATSDGKFIEHPRYFATSEQRLARLDRKFSRRVVGSGRWARMLERVARAKHHVANQRNDWLHKTTTRLVSEYKVIAVEDLNLAGLARSHTGKSMLDAGHGALLRMLAYKLAWANGELRKCDRYAATSKTCSRCGWKNDALTLADRRFVCASCGLVEDRDTNAAKNILAWASGPGADNARRGLPNRVPVKRVARGRWSRHKKEATHAAATK